MGSRGKMGVVLLKMQVADVLDHLLKPRGNGKAAAVGHIAEEYVEVADPIGQAGLEIAVAHGQLVKVKEHCVVDLVNHKIPTLKS